MQIFKDHQGFIITINEEIIVVEDSIKMETCRREEEETTTI